MQQNVIDQEVTHLEYLNVKVTNNTKKKISKIL
jgi:hypothetical protein